MSNLTKATDYNLESLKVDGTEIAPSFFSLEIFENIYSSGISGAITVVETASNTFLSDSELQGSEQIEFTFSTVEGNEFEFSGFVNRISDRVVAANSVSTFNIEFVSTVIKQNEEEFISHRFKDEKPQSIFEFAINKLNQDAEIPLKTDITKGDGMPMNFLASNWHPIRTCQYVQKHAVTQGSSAGDGEASGNGGLLFWETVKGIRFGSVEELLRGDLGNEVEEKLIYTLSNRGEGFEQTRNHILSYNNVQAADQQTQQRSGALKSKGIFFDLDKGEYSEKMYEANLGSKKQTESTRKHTRVFSRLRQNEAFSPECGQSPEYQNDQTPLSVQQTNSAMQNIGENVCQLTIPIRHDLNAGDKVDMDIYRVSAESADTLDERFSGTWIISQVAHHFLVEAGAAYSRLTCIRASIQSSGDDAGAPGVL